ncbi:serine hydrolase domain-containing protein [Colwellia psychrerythraea]|uniref:Beta-lactamase n=1 Tax=Colwellia psychrerythraea TaxID=28229 RepID=A0A099KXA7_COLPS|nr:serine hydrolase domain-containing protein [Colwellia psychrerythraea]KGJ95216.1 beta-lactamase [Colwellia psychrerythraea]
MQNKNKSLFINYIRAMFLLINLFFLSFSVNAENTKKTLSQLQQEIKNIQKSANIPALGVVLIDSGEPVWITSLGKANLAENTAVDEHSLFRIGSISKMFIGLSVLKLVEEGKLNLNDKVRDLAPEIAFENKWQATNPVLLVHLLEHTSGWGEMTLAEFAHTPTPPIALKEALMQYPQNRKSRWPAGTRQAYSNIGAAVASYIVEKTTGMLYEDYITTNFFLPLGMANSTYFKPTTNKVLTTTYINGEAQDYQPIIYRSEGAMNASPAEMANLLQFFIQQGEFLGENLISSDSLQRMQIPTTTLGSAQGITAGYGLTNYSSGFGEYNTAFHGHDGSIEGAMASLAYVPALNSGYVVMSSGGGAAMYKIVKLIKAYILRGIEPYKAIPTDLPSAFKKINGYYKKINPQNNLQEAFNDLLNLMIFSHDEKGFHFAPLLGSRSSSPYAISENLLTNPSNGLPSITLVNDPIVGEAIQLGMHLYVPVSKGWVWSKILLLIIVTILTSGTLLFALFWLPLNAYRKTLTSQQITSRLWPTLTSACFVIYVFSLVLVDSAGNLVAISKISPLSLTILALSLCYPLITIMSLFRLWQLKRGNEKSKGYWLSFSICGIHLLNVFLLASYGMIAFRIWLLYHI